jgi:hypothetical protein
LFRAHLPMMQACHLEQRTENERYQQQANHGDDQNAAATLVRSRAVAATLVRSRAVAATLVRSRAVAATRVRLRAALATLADRIWR